MLTAPQTSTYREDRWGACGEARRVAHSYEACLEELKANSGEHETTILTEAREDFNWKGPEALQSNDLQSPQKW